MVTANPLAKHFRQPALYLSLPSKGRFYSENGLELAANGTIPVYPMTVRDELSLKTPDALLSGQAIADVIKSCCPAIKDPWEIPAVDLDPIFIAMRLASYGKAMDFNSTCPHCNQSDEYSVDLNAVLDSVGKADYSKSYNFDGLTFKFRPQMYKNMNNANMINFEQEKLIQNIIKNEELTEEQKLANFNFSFNKIRELNLNLVIDGIYSVTTEDGIEVKDREMIAEFLESCSRAVYSSVKDSMEELTNFYKIPPLTLTCANEECQKEFKTNLTFDQSSFFG
jgi:hypothetical protein